VADPRDVPVLNIGAVSQATGLSEHTLRAWERRYGLPRPHRTPGGHRLYAPRDVEVLTWLLAEQQKGLSISQAVARWRQREAAGPNPPWEEASIGANPEAPASPLQALRAAWLSACLRFDEREAEALLSQAFALYPAETVCVEVLQWSLAAVGDAWYRGEASVQQEHFVSALSIRRLEALIASAPAPVRAQRVLVGCAPNEEHVFAPLLLTLLLRRRGWDVVFLGASVPIEGLDATVAETRPDLVVLSAESLPTAATLAEAAALLSQLGVALGCGGRIFNHSPQLRRRIAAHFLGESVPEAVRTVEALVTRPRPQQVAEPPTAAHVAALRCYQEGRPLIEARVMHDLAGVLSPSQLRTAQAFLDQHLVAALSLGDLSVLDDDLAWLRGFLERRGPALETLHPFLAANLQAATLCLDERAHPILEWLRDYTESA
jgi:DNA-binding transcriptional MerR regulator